MKNILKALWLTTIIFLLFSSQSYAADKTADNAAECFKRAEHFEKEANKYANDVRDPGKWFDLAMKNYLCAAQAGNALAMWRVVNLSGSGQVEALPKEMEDKYLFQAAEAGLIEAQLGLGVSYCDNVGSASPCKNAAEAEKWFLRAAKAGSAGGVFELGMLYERSGGGKDTSKLEKALACYKLLLRRTQLAINANNDKDLHQLKSDLEDSKWGIERTSKLLGVHDTTVTCF